LKGAAIRPPIDAVLMNNPWTFSRKYGMNAFVLQMGSSRLVSIMRGHDPKYTAAKSIRR
jgi:hypothetical protein